MYQKLFISAIIFLTVATAMSSVVLTPKTARAGALEDSLNTLLNALKNAPDASQKILLELLGGIETFLKTSKTQVSAKLIWTADQKNKANAKLDEGLTKVADFRTRTNAVDLDSANALSELKSIYNEGKTWWSGYQNELKVVWADILIENGNKTIAAAEAIEEKMNTIADSLKEDQIVDTTTLKSLVNQLSTEIDESKKNIELATEYAEKLKNASKPKDVAKYYADMRLEVSKATTNLLGDGRKVVNEILTEVQKLVQEIKENNK